MPISSDLISLLDEVLDASIKLLKADFGNIQLYDPNTKSLKIVAQRGFKQDFLDYFECVRLGDQSACSEALQHGKRVIIEDVELCPSYAPHRTIAASAGYRAVQSTPLLSRSGDLLGILSTHYRQPHRPAGRDLRTLDMYVHQAVDWIARRRAEEALRESQERLHHALESSRAGTWRVDFQTGLDTRDANLNRLLGLPAETTTQPIEEWFTFVHPEDRPAMDTAWEQALTTGVYEGEHRLISREGVIRWVYDRGCFVRDEAGQPLYATGAAIDITERKRVEEVMRESEQRFHTMADTAPVLIWMSGLDKECTYFNQRWFSYTGRTKEQELGSGWADGVHPEDFDRCLERYTEAFDLREPFQMEYRLRKADGQYGWLLDHGVPRYFPNGEFAGYIGSCIDLTEQKDLENRLRKTVKEKESLLREVHHRVKNNLQVISSLLNLQAASIKDPQVVQLFRECQTRIASIALLHETLHRSNDLSCISMSDYLRTLAGHVFRSYGVDPQVIVLDLLVEDLTFDIDTGMTCGMIVEELLSNSLKHAYAEGKGGRIQIELRAQDEGAYLLQVRDAGVGISKGGGQRNPASLGLELVNLLVDKLEGTVKLQSGPGTAWRIEFHQLHYQERM